MLQLPVELRRSCLELLEDDSKTLKAIRLVNKDLEILARELVFRKATLIHSDESTGRFVSLLESPFRDMIHQVTIKTSEFPGYTGDNEEEKEVNTNFGQAIALLKELGKLDNIELKFAQGVASNEEWANEVAETEQYRVDVLWLLFQGLCEADTPFALTIKNLQDSHDRDLFAREDFLAVRRRLKQLHLYIANEGHELCDEAIEAPALHDGFTNALPDIWLKPLTDKLTSLSLFGDTFWGVWPFVDFRQIPPFRQLKSLALGNFTIAFDWQIDWIISHAPSLEQLIFDDCNIVAALSLREDQKDELFPGQEPACVEPDEPSYLFHVSLRWHAVMDRFRTELPHLLHFTVGSGNWHNGQAFDQRYELASDQAAAQYCMFEHAARQYGGSNWHSGESPEGASHDFDSTLSELELDVPFPQCQEEDEKAYSELLEAVHARARAHL
jgi:hypothetical protein